MIKNSFCILIFFIFLIPLSILKSQNEAGDNYIPVITDLKSYRLGDSLLQLWNYEFRDTRIKNLRPHIFMDESGKLFLFSRKGFFTFDRHHLYELPQKNLFPTSDINQSFLDENNWLWLISNNFNPYRPVFSIQFFNVKTYEQKSFEEFFKGTILSKTRINSLHQLSTGELILSTSDEIVYLYHNRKLQQIDVDNEWVLKGVTKFDEMILWNTEKEQLAFKKIDHKAEYNLLPHLEIIEQIKECYIKNDYLLCLSGTDLEFGFYSLSLRDTSLNWTYHDFPKNIRFSYNSNHQHYIHTNDLKNFHQITGKGIKKSLILEIIVNNFNFLQSPNLVNAGASYILSSYDGIIIARISKKKVCTALVDESPKKLSSRGLKFQNNHLLVSSYSGFHTVDYDHKNCFKGIEKLIYPCSPRYTHQSIFLPDQNKLIKYSNIISIIDKNTGDCSIIDIHPIGFHMIWDMVPISDEWYLLATFNGLYLSDLNSFYSLPIEFFEKSDNSNREINLKNIEFFRLKYSIDSSHIFAASSMGLLVIKTKDTIINESSNWTISEWIYPNKIIRDVLELENGQLLLASANNGMLWIDNKKERSLIAEYNSSNILKNDFSHNILKDDLNRIWLSTNHGLYIIDLEKNIWRMLGQFNGFPDDEFNYLAAAKSEEGLFAFGGINGIAIFDPIEFNIVCSQSLLYLVSIEDDGQKITSFTNKKIDSTGEFSARINKNAKEVKFNFSGTSMNKFNNFLIRKSGNRNWIKISNSKIIPTKYLSSGKNEYEIAGLLKDGKIVLSHQKIYLNLQEGSWSAVWFLPLVLILPLLIIGFKKEKLLTKSKPSQLVEKHVEEKEFPDQKIDVFQPLKSSDTLIFEEHSELREVQELTQFLSGFREKEILPIKVEEQNIEFINSLKQNILESLGNDIIYAEHLAQLQTVSYRQLHRMLKEKTGLSPNKFISLVRVIEGRKILTTDWKRNIKEVNYYLGYNKPSHFSSLFKEVYGINPKKYQMKVSEYMEKIEEAIKQSGSYKSEKSD